MKIEDVLKDKALLEAWAMSDPDFVPPPLDLSVSPGDPDYTSQDSDFYAPSAANI